MDFQLTNAQRREWQIVMDNHKKNLKESKPVCSARREPTKTTRSKHSNRGTYKQKEGLRDIVRSNRMLLKRLCEISQRPAPPQARPPLPKINTLHQKAFDEENRKVERRLQSIKASPSLTTSNLERDFRKRQRIKNQIRRVGPKVLPSIKMEMTKNWWNIPFSSPRPPEQLSLDPNREIARTLLLQFYQEEFPGWDPYVGADQAFVIFNSAFVHGGASMSYHQSMSHLDFPGYGMNESLPPQQTDQQFLKSFPPQDSMMIHAPPCPSARAARRRKEMGCIESVLMMVPHNMPPSNFSKEGDGAFLQPIPPTDESILSDGKKQPKHRQYRQAENRLILPFEVDVRTLKEDSVPFVSMPSSGAMMEFDNIQQGSVNGILTTTERDFRKKQNIKITKEEATKAWWNIPFVPPFPHEDEPGDPDREMARSLLLDYYEDEIPNWDPLEGTSQWFDTSLLEGKGSIISYDQSIAHGELSTYGMKENIAPEQKNKSFSTSTHPVSRKRKEKGSMDAVLVNIPPSQQSDTSYFQPIPPPKDSNVADISGKPPKHRQYKELGEENRARPFEVDVRSLHKEQTSSVPIPLGRSKPRTRDILRAEVMSLSRPQDVEMAPKSGGMEGMGSVRKPDMPNKSCEENEFGPPGGYSGKLIDIFPSSPEDSTPVNNTNEPPPQRMIDLFPSSSEESPVNEKSKKPVEKKVAAKPKYYKNKTIDVIPKGGGVLIKPISRLSMKVADHFPSSSDEENKKVESKKKKDKTTKSMNSKISTQVNSKMSSNISTQLNSKMSTQLNSKMSTQLNSKITSSISTQLVPETSIRKSRQMSMIVTDHFPSSSEDEKPLIKDLLTSMRISDYFPSSSDEMEPKEIRQEIFKKKILRKTIDIFPSSSDSSPTPPQVESSGGPPRPSMLALSSRTIDLFPSSSSEESSPPPMMDGDFMMTIRESLSEDRNSLFQPYDEKPKMKVPAPLDTNKNNLYTGQTIDLFPSSIDSTPPLAKEKELTQTKKLYAGQTIDLFPSSTDSSPEPKQIEKKNVPSQKDKNQLYEGQTIDMFPSSTDSSPDLKPPEKKNVTNKNKKQSKTMELPKSSYEESASDKRKGPNKSMHSYQTIDLFPSTEESAPSVVSPKKKKLTKQKSKSKGKSNKELSKESKNNTSPSKKKLKTRDLERSESSEGSIAAHAAKSCLKNCYRSAMGSLRSKSPSLVIDEEVSSLRTPEKNPTNDVKERSDDETHQLMEDVSVALLELKEENSVGNSDSDADIRDKNGYNVF